VQDYRNLRVWQEAHTLALKTYAVIAYFKAPPAWPLRSQLLRAVISIASNIAEGAGRGSDPDFRRFLLHSLGSANELEYDLLLARDVGFLPEVEHSTLVAQVGTVRRMLSALTRSVAPESDSHAASGEQRLAESRKREAGSRKRPPSDSGGSKV
jgi:four helix bundle protein